MGRYICDYCNALGPTFTKFMRGTVSGVFIFRKSTITKNSIFFQRCKNGKSARSTLYFKRSVIVNLCNETICLKVSIVKCSLQSLARKAYWMQINFAARSQMCGSLILPSKKTRYCHVYSAILAEHVWSIDSQIHIENTYTNPTA